tara:strand:+ start:269 stop:805 length:537 start_codon:yes stop_codon:yes gene_type:complete
MDNSDMTTTSSKIGFGGGCHWCTEGVFESLLGITYVNQGWIASSGDNSDYSEAVEVSFDPSVISLSELIEIHLHTHASRSNHSMRGKYRSAIYAYDDSQFKQATNSLDRLRASFDDPLITRVYGFESFKKNRAELTNYFYSAPDRPFCQSYIEPKLKLLMVRFNRHVNKKKMAEVGLI